MQELMRVYISCNSVDRITEEHFLIVKEKIMEKTNQVTLPNLEIRLLEKK